MVFSHFITIGVQSVSVIVSRRTKLRPLVAGRRAPVLGSGRRRCLGPVLLGRSGPVGGSSHDHHGHNGWSWRRCVIDPLLGSGCSDRFGLGSPGWLDDWRGLCSADELLRRRGNFLLRLLFLLSLRSTKLLILIITRINCRHEGLVL